MEREEVIKKSENKLKEVKREKERISKKLREYEDRKGGLEQENEDLAKQLQIIKTESKMGEELMRKQVQEIRLERDILRSKYDNETLIRKRLHNVIEDMKGKIRVFCRVRPMNGHEE